MSDSSGSPEQTPDGPQFNPQTGYPVGQEPYPQQYPPYGQQPYPPYQQQYGQPYPPYQQQYGQYAAPNHPKATTALVLGLISVVGGFMCVLPVLASPFAWVTGVKARKEIRQANGQLAGEGMATAGMVLGIIGTVLLALVLLGILVLVIVAVNDPSALDESGTV